MDAALVPDGYLFALDLKAVYFPKRQAVNSGTNF